MKKIIYIISAAVLCLCCSCNKISNGGSANTDGEKYNCRLTVNCGWGARTTKVAAQTATNEKTIQNVQVFVFRAGTGSDAGKLDVAASKGFDSPIGETSGTWSALEMKCSTGEREIWAVVNDAVDHTAGSDAIANKEQFLGLTSELKNNTATKLCMVGSASATLHEGRESITVDVRRLCASVILESVMNSFASPGYQKTGVFKVTDCYLLNVPGKVNFGQSIEPASLAAADWYARLSPETSSPQKDLIYDTVTPKVVEYGEYDSTIHTFYAYPNDCLFSTDASWSPRATVLVLEALISDGNAWNRYYYPVALTNGLQANKQYRVNLIVKRPGSLDPNVPVTFDDVTPVVTVSDWQNGGSYNPEV